MIDSCILMPLWAEHVSLKSTITDIVMAFLSTFVFYYHFSFELVSLFLMSLFPEKFLLWIAKKKCDGTSFWK